MTSAETSRSCCVCKKLFCCAQCRERHEKSKHSDQELNCPLCTSRKLLLQSFEDKSLLSHIVTAHLPLCCCLCGEIFKQSEDLESFGTCKWWKSRHRHSLISEPKSILRTPPLILEGKDSHLENEYNGNFGSLTSPPALSRNTSTPMVVGQKNTFDFKTPNVPNFSLKTPKSNSISLKKDQTHTGLQDSSESNYISFPSSANHGETPFRSLSSNCGNKDDFPRTNSKQLNDMEERNQMNSGDLNEDNNDIEEMELTDVGGNVLLVSQSLEMCVQTEKRSDSLKKVRFSDEYSNPTEANSKTTFNRTENEEYFETCDALSSEHGIKDDSLRIISKKMAVTKGHDQIAPRQPNEDDNDIEIIDLTCTDKDELPDSQNLEMCVQVEKRSDSLKRVRFSDEYDNPIESSTTIFNKTENEEYFEACETLSEIKENLENSRIKIYENNAKNIEKESIGEDKPKVTINQQSSGSSRMVMMVVVENNSSLSTSDLINSGLKKLEYIASGVNLSNSNRNSPDGGSSVMSVDSYYSVSNHDPCSTSNQTISSERRDSNSSSNSSGSSSSSGIFSAFANVVRNVMNSFPGMGTSKNIEKEQISAREDIASRPSTSGTFNPMSNLTSSLARRPGKRPRDTLESISSPQRQLDYAVPQIEPRSPLAKRHRGWYQIKGREPIARMRNNRLTSPRGVSSETQVFHQGSLSVRDTILPLPSRAHQYTQTE